MNKSRKDDLSKFKQLKTNDEIVAPLWINFRNDPAQSIYPVHDHAWGEFVYSFNGVLEVNIANIDYITPPPYGIWLPPNLEHSGLNRTAVSHGTLYIHESLCEQLPKHAGIMLTTPLVSALLHQLRDYPQDINDPAHLRLLNVLLDQLINAELIRTYLPHSNHLGLKQILDYLHQNPADHSSLDQLAQMSNMTERTLARYSQKELGMSIHEWRQRLKVMKAMSMLNEGKKVESIALDLGYANATAFINMFKRWMNLTPDQFRKR